MDNALKMAQVYCQNIFCPISKRSYSLTLHSNILQKIFLMKSVLDATLSQMREYGSRLLLVL